MQTLNKYKIIPKHLCKKAEKKKTHPRIHIRIKKTYNNQLMCHSYFIVLQTI